MALSKKVIRMTGEAIAGISVASANGMYVACTSSSGNFEAGTVYYCNGSAWISTGGGGSSIEFDHEIYPDGAIGDEGGEEITDETGEPISDENSVSLISGCNGEKIGAERAKCDAEGNDFRQTYAKKSDIETVIMSLAASFESRAPSYVWKAGEVCTYSSRLWMFDRNHSGAWSGADAHEVTILEVLNIYTPFDAITDWIDISDEFVLANNFTSIYAGQDTKKIYYSPSKNILHFDPICRFFRNTQISNDWTVFLKYTGNRFYTTETFDQNKYPKKYGIYNGIPLYSGALKNGDGSQKYVYLACTGNPDYPNLQGFSVESAETGNYGIIGPFTFTVTPK